MKEALWCQSDIKTHSQKLKPNVQLAVNLRCSTDNWILFYHQWLWGKWRNSVAISQTQPVPQLTQYLTEEFRVSMGNWGLGNLQKSLPLGQKLGPKHIWTMYPKRHPWTLLFYFCIRQVERSYGNWQRVFPLSPSAQTATSFNNGQNRISIMSTLCAVQWC